MKPKLGTQVSKNRGFKNFGNVQTVTHVQKSVNGLSQSFLKTYIKTNSDSRWFAPLCRGVITVAGLGTRNIPWRIIQVGILPLVHAYWYIILKYTLYINGLRSNEIVRVPLPRLGGIAISRKRVSRPHVHTYRIHIYIYYTNIYIILIYT